MGHNPGTLAIPSLKIAGEWIFIQQNTVNYGKFIGFDHFWPMPIHGDPFIIHTHLPSVKRADRCPQQHHVWFGAMPQQLQNLLPSACGHFYGWNMVEPAKKT